MVRYAIMFFSLFFLFLILIVGPIIASKFIDPTIDIMQLQQPSNWKNNDTLGSSETGTALAQAAATSAGAGAAAFKRTLMFTYGS